MVAPQTCHAIIECILSSNDRVGSRDPLPGSEEEWRMRTLSAIRCRDRDFYEMPLEQAQVMN
jgi:hypothetical protein